ncbi:MAG: hypothetical protein QW038_02695 [Nanopusillaceae archaeon]
MALPITFLFVITLFSFSVYYDLRERRIPNWIILYFFIFLTLYYLYIGIFYEFELMVKQLYYSLQLFLFLFIIYFFGGLNAGDVKFLMASTYAIPYIYIKYTVLENLPLISIFLNLGICGFVYFCSSLNLKILKNKIKNILLNFSSLLVYIVSVVAITRIVLSYIFKIFYLHSSIFSNILLAILFISFVGIFLKKIKNNKKIYFLVFIMSVLYLIYEGAIKTLFFIIIILAIISVYNSLKDEPTFKRESIPFSVFIIISILLTLIFQGDIVTFLRYFFKYL